MAANSDIGRYEDLVYDLLDSYRGLRDDVGQLYLACIMRIRGENYIKETSLYKFFFIDANNRDLPKIPSMSSIIRLNTRLQKEHPHLRGKDWEKRQKHSKDYKEDLGYGN